MPRETARFRRSSTPRSCSTPSLSKRSA
jgi:hypothetical protein